MNEQNQLPHTLTWLDSPAFVRGCMTVPAPLTIFLKSLASPFSLPINVFSRIMNLIEPAKAMRESVSSNWRVTFFWGAV